MTSFRHTGGMRSHCILFVDAGYLLAASSTRVTGTSLRGATDADLPGLLGSLIEHAEKATGLPLLRALWYDAGTRSGTPSAPQRELGLLPKAKLRLGRTGFNGEQKGVDVKLALDLTTLSRNRAADVMFLVSGDDDLSEAVEEAQQHGVQVISLAVPDGDGKPISVSANLQLTVDDVHVIDGSVIDLHVKQSASAAMKRVADAGAPEAVPSQPAADQVTVRPAAAGNVPTPLVVKPLKPVPTVPAITPKAESKPAYSTSTGEGSGWTTHDPVDDKVEEAIVDVVDKVVMNWWRTATPANQADLARSRPFIPGELDRALLNDLSSKLSVVDVPQEWRFRLRDVFWDKYERL